MRAAVMLIQNENRYISPSDYIGVHAYDHLTSVFI